MPDEGALTGPSLCLVCPTLRAVPQRDPMRAGVTVSGPEPPTRPARSSGVVSSQRFHAPAISQASTGWPAKSAYDVHLEFAQLAVLEDGVVRDEGRICVTPAALRVRADGLRLALLPFSLFAPVTD